MAWLFGVDSLAHAAALKTGGQCIAVLPSGVEKVYPASHALLAKEIVESGGTLISEYPAQHTPRPEHFLERTRIIAALSDIVLITEAAVGSG